MRCSLLSSLSLGVLAFGTATAAQAQISTQDPSAFIPRYSVTLGFNHVRANAPPAQCGCFEMNGGFGSLTVPVRYWLSAAAEITAGHANNIGPLGQNLTLTTYTAGPRVTFRGARLVPFAQVLLGAAHGGDSYFPGDGTFSTSATSFAFSTGGGVDYHLNHHFAVHLLEAQYLHTSFPNATNDGQNHLMLGTGLVFKFGGRYAMPAGDGRRTAPRPMAPLPPPPQPPVASAAMTDQVPAPPPVISPAPAVAAAVPTPSVTEPQPMPPPPPVPLQLPKPMQDVFFDYNSAEPRLEARPKLEQVATWLSEHPQVKLLLAGYADERGSADYDLNLGKRRAIRVQQALLQYGIPADRLRVLSYGKSMAVCSVRDESCWQRNRRVAFVVQP